MAKLRITVDDDVLERARARARRQGTSVNAVLAESLARYAGGREEQMATVARLVALGSANVERSVGAPFGTRFSRDELHER